MNKIFDVIIVGAGPAGATSALCAADKGLSVALIDKAIFPRDKVCGDGLTKDVTDQLPKIPGLSWERFESNKNRITSKGARVHLTSGEHVDITYKSEKPSELLHVMPRLDFDNYLFSACQEKEQIRIFQGENVKTAERVDDLWFVQLKGQVLESHVLFVANGANSSLKRSLFPEKLDKRYHAAAVRAYFDGVEGLDENGLMEFYLPSRVRCGYFWIFPLPDGKANVGLGVQSQVVSKEGINVKKEFEIALATHPLKDRFKNAKPISEVEGFGLPLGGRRKPISGEGFLLLGDAANLIDPVTGEGIANAIRSGRFAADQLERILSTKDYSAASTKQYDKMIYKAVFLELKLSSIFQKLLGKRKMMNWILPKIVKDSYLMNQFTGEFNLTKICWRFLNPWFWLKPTAR